MVLVCCQVDDFAIVSTNPAITSKLVSMINTKVTVVDKGIGDVTICDTFPSAMVLTCSRLAITFNFCVNLTLIGC